MLFPEFTHEDGTDFYKINCKETDGYYISKCSKVYSSKSNKYLQTKINNGYETIALGKKVFTLHRLVALTFIPTDNSELYVDHINNIKTDNRVENLQWVTQKENINKNEIDTSHPRIVVKKDLNGNVLEEYNSVTEAGEANGVTRYAISKNCLKINKTCAGFIFEYKDDDKHAHELIDVSQGKPVDGYENYLAFADGSIYNTKTKKYLSPVENEKGYCYVTLCKKDTKKKNMYVHILIANAFIPNSDPENKIQVNHMNKIKNDNRVENLEWVTRSENMTHANKINIQIKKEDAIKMLIEYCEEFGECPNATDCYKKHLNYTIGNFFSKLKTEEINSTTSDYYKELSKYPLLKENLDEYLGRKKQRMTYDQGLQLCFEYVEENKIVPDYKETYKGYPIGAWYRQKKKEILEKTDKKYKDLAVNSIIKKDLDNLFKRKKSNNEV